MPGYEDEKIIRQFELLEKHKARYEKDEMSSIVDTCLSITLLLKLKMCKLIKYEKFVLNRCRPIEN